MLWINYKRRLKLIMLGLFLQLERFISATGNYFCFEPPVPAGGSLFWSLS